MSSSQPPRDIPGFYYDAERGKYFRIQANHQSPSGTAAKRYTTQVVQNERRRHHERRQRQAVDQERRRRRVERDAFMTHPVHGLDLSVRLGARTWISVGDGVRRQYAQLLRPNTVLSQRRPGPKFSIEPVSKVLFTTMMTDSGGWENAREMCVTPVSDAQSYHHHITTSGGEGENRYQNCNPGDRHGSLARSQEGPETEADVHPKYDPVHATSILNAADPTVILPLSESALVWACLSPTSRGDMSPLCFSRRYASDSVPWRNWWEGFGEWGTTVHQLHGVVWDAAAPRTEEGVLGGIGGSVVLATDNGIKVCDIGGSGSGMGVTDVWALKKSSWLPKEEYMAVAFKDRNVFMAGERRGAVVFGDLRVKSSTIRLMHRSAVSGLRRMRNENLVLVSGFEGMEVYDLRFGGWKRNAKRYDKEDLTDAVLKFDVPFSMQQTRYGMGFDYNEELNVVAAASTDFGTTHRVGLWDCGTGKRIEEGLLTKKDFKEPVTCLQMVDLRGDGQATKSIVTVSAGVVKEWHV